MYCAGNPVRLVDVDGNKVKVFMAKASVSCGIGIGASGAIFRGAAYDDFGVTHFSGMSYMIASGNGGIWGCDVNVGVQFAYDTHYSSFYNYSNNSFTASAPINIHDCVGGSAGYTAHSEDKLDGIVTGLGIGEGMSVSFGSENVQLHESISVSFSEADVINGDSHFGTTWHVSDVKLDNGGTTYSGYVNGKVKVSCKAVVQDGIYRPNNIWMSQEYFNNESQDGN